jgi:hypothetical protein
MILLERRGGRQGRVDCGPPSDPPKGFNFNSNVGNMLIMQPDGNMVILDAQKQPCWAANTQAPNANILYNPNDLNTRAVLGPQGILTAYDSTGNAWWSSLIGSFAAAAKLQAFFTVKF